MRFASTLVRVQKYNFVLSLSLHVSLSVPCSDTGPWLLVCLDQVVLKTLRLLTAATHTKLILSDS